MDALARFLAARPMPAAIVAGVDGPPGLRAIRSLARAGAPAVALDHRCDALGFRSRFAFPVRCPHPESEPRAFFAFLEELSERLGRAAPVFPTSGEYHDAFSEADERLPGRFLLPSAGRAAEGSADPVRVVYWELLGARLPAAPVDGSPGRFAIERVDLGPALAGAMRVARGRRR